MEAAILTLEEGGRYHRHQFRSGRRLAIYIPTFVSCS